MKRTRQDAIDGIGARVAELASAARIRLSLSPAPPLTTDKKKWLIIIIATVLALNSPWLLEGSSGNCAAAEHLALRQTVNNIRADGNDQRAIGMARGLWAMSDGRVMTMAMEARFPVIPTSMGCAGFYWYAQIQ